MKIFKTKINIHAGEMAWRKSKKSAKHSLYYMAMVVLAFVSAGSFFAYIVKGSVVSTISGMIGTTKIFPQSLSASAFFDMVSVAKADVTQTDEVKSKKEIGVPKPGLVTLPNVPASNLNLYTSVAPKSASPIANFSENKKSLLELQVNSSAYYAETLVRDSFFGKTHSVEHNADAKLPIASLTKLITAVVAREGMSTDSHVKIDKQALSTYGTTCKFKEGNVFTLQEITYPLLITSSNDAAEAIAEAYPGGRKVFLSRMNAWVQKIGAKSTYFADPSGLSSGNVSTARDLATIAKYIYSYYPDLVAITRQKTASVRSISWTNHTHFLNMSNYIGGKNGFTDEAGRTTISFFEINRMGNRVPMVAIILGSVDRDKDTLELVDYMQKVN